MSNAMYQASVRTFTHNLKNLSAILKTAAKDARARGIDPEVFLVARVAPDMLPLTTQIQIVTDNAKGACARLAGVEVPVFKDDETSFAQLQARIKRTLAYLRTLKPAQFEGSQSRDIQMELPVGTLYFNGMDYLNGFALPNFYFHISTAYTILRHNGVPLGKADFLGKVPGVQATGQIARMMGLPTTKPAKKAGKAATKKAAPRKAPGKKAATSKAAGKKRAGKKSAAS